MSSSRGTTHPFAAFVERKTRRLLLRPYVASDFAAWRAAWLGALRQRNRWDTGPRTDELLTRAAFGALLKRQKHARTGGQVLLLGAFERKSGALIGAGAYENLVLGCHQSVQIGFEVINNHWGQGFGSEIASALIRGAFSDFALHRVEALVSPANRRSLAVCRRVGLRREGLSKARLYSLEGWRDMVIMACTAD